MGKKGMLQEAIDEYNVAVSLRPDYAEAYYNLGFALDTAQMSAMAVEAYRKFIDCAPSQYASYVDHAKQHVREMGNA
jgi:tetratricopeptide (TPR) repeat protein